MTGLAVPESDAVKFRPHDPLCVRSAVAETDCDPLRETACDGVHEADTTSAGLPDCEDDGDRPTALAGVCDIVLLPELRCDEVAVCDNDAETTNGCETP